jgi:hypothetical protein
MGKTRPADREHQVEIINSTRQAKRAQKQRGGAFKKYYSLMGILTDKKKYDSRIREGLIKHMTKPQHKALDEAVSMALDPKISMEKSDEDLLRRHKNSLREYASLKKNPEAQKKLLLHTEQRGGFLSLLIPIIASIIGSVASTGISHGIKAIKKHKKKH